MALFGRKPAPTPIVPLLFGTEAPMPAGLELPSDQAPILGVIAEDLAVAYAFDQPHGYQLVKSADFAEHGIADHTVLHARAIATLRERAEKELSIEGGDGRYRVTLTGPSRDLTASLLLAPDLFLPSLVFTGTPVVGIGSRIWLHFTDSAHPENFDGLRGLVSDLHDAGDAKPINTWLYGIQADGSLQRV